MNLLKLKNVCFKLILLICFCSIFLYMQKLNDITINNESIRKRLLKVSNFRSRINFTLKKLMKEEDKWKKENNIPEKLISNKDLEIRCARSNGLVFVKTHKTGSTTLSNIILRHAEKNKLLVGLPPQRHWELGGYPDFFREELVDPQAERYDVFCHHQRFDFENVKKKVTNNSLFITILRDPVHQFESGIGFFRDWPFQQWLNDTPRAQLLDKFMENPNFYYNTSTPWNFRAKNYMSFDLGLNHLNTDQQYIDWAIQYIGTIFDLVMITERMDESLILLKEMLCMESFNDIIYLRLKVRQNGARYTLKSSTRGKIKKWNSLDAGLYRHFSLKLNEKIKLYGEDKMKNDLKEFRKLLKKTEESCVEYYDSFDMKPWVSRIELKKDSGESCSKLSWGEVKFGDYIRSLQSNDVRLKPSKQLSYKQLVSGLQNAQMNILGKEIISKSRNRMYISV